MAAGSKLLLYIGKCLRGDDEEGGRDESVLIPCFCMHRNRIFRRGIMTNEGGDIIDSDPCG